jgi:hypothetical protein
MKVTTTMATKSTRATTPSTSTTANSNGTTATNNEQVTPAQRYGLAMNAAIKDLREFTTVQPQTRVMLIKALRAKNSAELMQAQADWMLRFTTESNDTESMGLFAQLLNIITNLSVEAATSQAVKATPAEILATRLHALSKAHTELVTEFVGEHGADAYNDVAKLINDENWAPYIGEDKFSENVANAIKVVKTHTLPRGKKPVNATDSK